MQLRINSSSRKDFLNISLLILVAIIIFYPVLFTGYAYTDDWVELWRYKSQGNDLVSYGRYITESLNNWLYHFINVKTVHDLIYIRLFSFFGWLICIPVWYFIIKKIVTKENFPPALIFFSVLYLICTPSFSIYIGWASCFELFIANTAGLISGYILYSSIKYEDERIVVPSLAILGCVLFGVISLFTYQNGFGCFVLPFLLHLLARPKKYRVVTIGLGFYLFIYVVYYLLFRYNLRSEHAGESERTKFAFDFLPKIAFFFARPMTTAFHFTYLVNEKSIPGIIVSMVLFSIFLIRNFYQYTFLAASIRLKIILVVLLMLMSIYLPSLVVKEMYSSNRTLFALNMAAFFLVATTILTSIKNYKPFLVGIASLLFVCNAWYNFNKQFLSPIKNEYRQVRSFIETHYNSSITTINFIQPHEDFFVNKYGITRSWDEFGVPSTFFNWVPGYFVKQVIFEKTGDRSIAEKLIVNQFTGKKQFSDNSLRSSNVMVVDAEQIMK